ncbi:Scarecrow-like protein 32 [Acorus calamus]|uniref:Scarecrow-like protein 32 n=1 Tax=Acorus calamus TaxID=4465 RepID=A0AAV9C8P2_ACOCL|nr:Scarecrow-like protein 32 [Acorus calamus]
MKTNLRNNNTTPPQPLPIRGCHIRTTLDGSCIEKLLLHCSAALEAADATVAQQVMWVINNVASSGAGGGGGGDTNQRLASWFLRALVSRAAALWPTFSSLGLGGPPAQPMSITELAGYVDLLPWHRFGFCAANRAIIDTISGGDHNKLHVLDFGVAHCMQWPTLIDSLSKHPYGPPSRLRITIVSDRPPVPPFLDVPLDEVGVRLTNFARSRGVPFEFRATSDPFTLDGGDDDEALIVNCQNWLRYLPDSSARDGFLEKVRKLGPELVIVVDEDSNVDSRSLQKRVSECFNYVWIPFDALETFLAKDDERRIEYEADLGRKIECIVGSSRWTERLESGARWAERIRGAGFKRAAFGEGAVEEVKGLLNEHASGWGMKREEDMLVLTWKGHNSVFASAWVPC